MATRFARLLVGAAAAASLLSLAGCLGRGSGNYYSGGGQPIYGDPGYGQPGYGQPGYGQPAYVQPPQGGYYEGPVINRPGETWTRIGRRDINLRPEEDIIDVNNNQGFRRLQLVVEGADVRLQKVRIRFADDNSVYEPPVTHVFDHGNRAVIIDLPGRVRAINRMAIVASAVRGTGGKARITIYGQ